MPETGEERFWRSLCPKLFAPGPRAPALTRALNHVAVTPLAHITFLNLDYQIYLNQVLHTSAVAWLGHLILIPLNVGLCFYALAIYTAGGSFAINGGLLLLLFLASWYMAMAMHMRARLWGLVSLLVVVGLWMLANVGASLALASELPWYLEPITLMIGCATLQAYSHLFEDNVPPRANFTRHWMPARKFLWEGSGDLPLGQRLVRLAWTAIGGVWGTIDEWWASSKLLPLYMLELMWMCGYQRERRDRFRRVSLAALASGDPALDWVGYGGGCSVVELGEGELSSGTAPPALAR